MSSTVLQVTTVAGFVSQVPVALLQKGRPLHRSPSSLSAHSASPAHLQPNTPPLHSPLRQKSPRVQLSPSSQGAELGSGAIAHLAVAGWQVFLTQAVSMIDGHCTIVAGLIAQVPSDLSQ